MASQLLAAHRRGRPRGFVVGFAAASRTCERVCACGRVWPGRPGDSSMPIPRRRPSCLVTLSVPHGPGFRPPSNKPDPTRPDPAATAADARQPLWAHTWQSIDERRRARANGEPYGPKVTGATRIRSTGTVAMQDRTVQTLRCSLCFAGGALQNLYSIDRQPFSEAR